MSQQHVRAGTSQRGEELSSFRQFLIDQPPRRTDAGDKVAIIGSGPAGLAAAHDLALLGFRPTVFEMESVPAGMLAVGIYDIAQLAREIGSDKHLCALPPSACLA